MRAFLREQRAGASFSSEEQIRFLLIANGHDVTHPISFFTRDARELKTFNSKLANGVLYDLLN